MARWQFSKGLHDLGRGGFAYMQPDGGYGYSNAGLVVDGDASLLVDTLFDYPLTREMLAEMRQKVPQAHKIDTVVNTHAHPDHTAGNGLVDGAEIIASTATLEEMKMIASPHNPFAKLLKNWQQFGEAGQYMHDVMGSKFEVHAEPQVMPTQTFDSEMTVQVGSKAVQLLKVGPAHSKGDTLVFVPQDKLLFTGDVLFHEVHPLIMPGAASSWIAACEQIMGWEVDVVVPGHGPLTDLSGVRKLRDYLVYFRDESRKRYDAGMGYREATLDISLTTCKDWADEERIFATVSNFYIEFGAKPVDMLEVMTESARYRRYKLMGCSEHGASCKGYHLPATDLTKVTP